MLSAVILHECRRISGQSKSFGSQLWIYQIRNEQWSGMGAALRNRAGNDVYSQILPPDCPISLAQGFADHPWKWMKRLHQLNWAMDSLHTAAWLVTVKSATACCDKRTGRTRSCGLDKSRHRWGKHRKAYCRSQCWSQFRVELLSDCWLQKQSQLNLLRCNNFYCLLALITLCGSSHPT